MRLEETESRRKIIIFVVSKINTKEKSEILR